MRDYLIRGLDVLHGDVDALELRVVLDCGTAVLAPETRGLVAAEGQFNGRHVVVVDPAGASLELRDDAVRTRQVGGENSGRQSELGLVGAADDFGFLIEGQYAHHRPEYFLPHDAHVVAAQIEDGRLDKKALAQGARRHAPAADGQARAFGAAQVNVLEHRVQMGLRDQRADLRSRIERITNAQGAGAGNETLHEVRHDTPLDKDARAV